jgi:phosphatidylinositol alpha-1,6-mannosyltransferase
MPVVLTISRLARGRSKGHDVVMRAMAESQMRFEYVVAGDGDDRARLEALAHELGVADRVRFLGRVPDEQLPHLYRGCDAFVLVSAFKLGRVAEGEGVPLVVLEAQACGKPVVTSSRDGSAESIVDGDSGYLVEPHDVSAVRAAIEKLIADDGLRGRMAVAARRSAVEQFSFDVFRNRIGEALAA